MLNDLNGEWVAFQQCLIDSDIMLKKHKVFHFYFPPKFRTLFRNYGYKLA